MRLTLAINTFIQYLDEVERKSPLTCVGYHKDLLFMQKLADDNNVTMFTPELVSRTLAELRRRGRSVATAQRYMAAMRKFAIWGMRSEHRLWSENPTRDLPKLRAPKRHPKPFTRDELGRLMRLELPPQERAIRGLLYWTGVRATPLCNLTPDDVDFAPQPLLLPDGRTITVAGRIKSLGKGTVETTHYMQQPLKDVLFDQWLRATSEERRTLLWRRGGEPHDLSSLRWLCAQWGKKAGVAKVHPHRFRHSFATEMLRQGKGIATVRVLMGHTSVATTMGYAEVDGAMAADAALSLSDEWWTPGIDRGTAMDAEIAALEAKLAALKRSRDPRE